MIIVKSGKLCIPEHERFIGFAGDNLNSTKQFSVENIADENCIYRLYLKFDDGTVNHFVLDSKVENGSTTLNWTILEEHIFKSGIVYAQIKSMADDGEIYHTTWDYFYADQSAESSEEFKYSENAEFLRYEKELNKIYKMICDLSFDGTQMKSIKNLEINADGELIVVLSDDSTRNLGRVKGDDGDDGNDGYSPKLSVVPNDNGFTLNITHADNSVESFLIKHGNDGYSPIKGVDYYTDEDKAEINSENINYINSELAKRGQLKPEFANSIEECTDTTKLYVLPDGYIYSYMKRTEEVVTPGETVTTPAKAVIIKGYRYSHSSQAFSAHSTSASVVFPIEITKETDSSNPVLLLLTNMLRSTQYTGMYHGSTNTNFEGNTAQSITNDTSATNYSIYGLPTGKWFVVFFIQYTGTETFEDASFSYDGVTFAVGDNMEVYSDPSDVSNAVMSSTTTTEGTTEIIETEGFFNTGIPFAPADYEDRIISLETDNETNSDRITVLEDTIKNADVKSKKIVLNNSITALDSSISMTVPQLKKNKTIAFFGTYTDVLDELTIVQGEGTGFTEVKCVVNATSITIIKDSETVYTAEHGLTFGSYFSIVLATKNLNKTKAYLSSGGNTFTSAEFVWNSSRSTLNLYTSTPFTQYQFSFGSSDFDKKVWLYGDSYFDHWLPLSINRGYTNCLADGYSGGGSSAGLASFKLALNYGKPSKVVWCLGMNDGDTTSVNQSWLNAVNTVKEICKENNIELWVTTIPNVESITHTAKNAYIRGNFKNIDIAKYVGANDNTSWYTGLLSSDKIHPSTEGDFYIASIMENLFPELLDA